MNRPEFLADHDLNEHIVDGVLRREPSIRLIRVREVGLDKRPDHEILEYAARKGLIVVSHDVNTMPAPAVTRVEEGLPMAGLLMVHQSDPVGASSTTWHSSGPRRRPRSGETKCASFRCDATAISNQKHGVECHRSSAGIGEFALRGAKSRHRRVYRDAIHSPDRCGARGFRAGAAC